MIKRLLTLFICGFMLTPVGILANYSISLSGNTPATAVTALKNATGYEFVYQKNLINNIGKKISGNFKNQSMEQLLDNIICDQMGLSYEIVDNTVILKEPQETHTSDVRNLSGIVLDAETKEPVIGASVMIDGSNIGTSTDLEGRFKLAGIPANAKKVRISYVGMHPQLLNIRPQMTVYLRSSIQAMDEVIVVAYGSAKKGSFTGSASTVGSAQLGAGPTTSVTEALVGAAPGVQVTTANGQPGSSPSIYIRGVGSFNASNTPLIILDGLPYDNSISSINPNDIENITILKDAASSALYGSRAANGVLMITTKKGSKEKMQVNVRFNQGFTAKQSGDYNKVGVRDYLTVYWENLRNQYVSDGRTPEEAGQRASANLFNAITYNPFNVPADQVVDANGQLNPNAEFMWADDCDWENAIQHLGSRTDAGVSISGGTSKSTYYTSVGYTDEHGYIKGSRFKRYTASANANSQITPWLRVGTNLTGNISYSYGNQNESQGNNINPFRFIRYIGPIYPVHLHNPETGEYLRDADGNLIYDFGTGYSVGGIEVPKRDYVSGNNPAIELQKRVDEYRRNTINAKVFAEIKFLKDFKFTFNGGVGSNSYLATSAGVVYEEKGNTGNTSKTNSFTTTWTFNQLLEYNKDFGEHHLDVLLGHESYDYEYNHLNASKKDQKFDNNYELNNYTNIDSTPTSYTNKYKTEGYFSRLNYSFNERYFLSGSFRRDGSSRFHKNSRWGNFWSAGAAWRLDQEKFMAGVNFVNVLKLRAAYGEIGNDDLGSYYPWRATYENAQNANEAGYIQDSLGNPDLKWEVSRNFDVALEFSLFDNRFRGTLEFFNRKSSNLLFSVPLSYSTGIDSQLRNAGSMYNRGFEFELGYSIFTGKPLTWDISLNGTHIKNKITSLPIDPYKSGTHKIEAGHSRYNFFLRQWRGVDPATGNSLYIPAEEYLATSESLVEVNGTTYTTDYKEALEDYCGDALPKLQGGLTTNLAWRGFNLGMTFYYQFGGKMYDTVYSSLMQPGTGSLSYQTVHVDIMKRWQKPGDITDVPRISNGTDATSLYASSDRWLVSSDMLELATINLGYTLPKSLVRRFNVDNLKFYFSAENIFQITRRKGIYPRKNISGYSSNGDVYLPSRVFTLGFNLTF